MTRMAKSGKIITCYSMHLNTCVIMNTQAYMYMCAVANACMPMHMHTCLHTLIYIKWKCVRLDMHTKEIHQVRAFWVFHWLSHIIRLAMGLIIPSIHSIINQFCCPCNNLGVFILYQNCAFLHVGKGGKIRIFILNSTKEAVALVCDYIMILMLHILIVS